MLLKKTTKQRQNGQTKKRIEKNRQSRFGYPFAKAKEVQPNPQAKRKIAPHLLLPHRT
jgi:hypothetical protein